MSQTKARALLAEVKTAWGNTSTIARGTAGPAVYPAIALMGEMIERLDQAEAVSRHLIERMNGLASSPSRGASNVSATKPDPWSNAHAGPRYPCGPMPGAAGGHADCRCGLSDADCAGRECTAKGWGSARLVAWCGSCGFRFGPSIDHSRCAGAAGAKAR